jgi:hypothetical protein
MVTTTTTNPADVAELLRWARENRPTMAETTAGCIRRLEAENARLRARIEDLEQQILVALGEVRR